MNVSLVPWRVYFTDGFVGTEGAGSTWAGQSEGCVVESRIADRTAVESERGGGGVIEV